MSALLRGRFEEPEVTLVDSKVEAISSSAANVTFDLDVFNPNPYSLRLRAIRYRLSVGGKVMAHGDAPAVVALPAHGKAIVYLPAVLDFDALQSVAHAAMMTGEIPYQLEAWFQVGALVLEREVSFVDSSVLRLNLPLGLARTRPVAFPHRGWQS